MKYLFLFICGCTLIQALQSANILMLSGVPSPSHFIFNRVLVEGLAARGHNVTFVSPDVDKKGTPNVHYIHLEKTYAHFYNGSEHIDLLEMSHESVLAAVFSFWDFGKFQCEGTALSEGLKIIRNYPDNFKFDLVIHDYTCGACLLGLLPKFKYPPLVQISAFNNPPYTADIVGGDKLGLTAKPFYTLNYDNDMTIFERIHNGFINFLDSFYRKHFVLPMDDKIMKQMFGDNLPYVGDLEKKAVLALVNSHPAIDFAESVPPNIIQVGGLQIAEPKPVAKEFDDFLRKGKKGSIIMCLGTNMRSDAIGKEKIKMFIEAFRQMPDYNFLWKFETSEMIKNLPANVMISDWLPQNDILAHPSIKAFISHGGLLSSHEAIWRGVPIVGIPFFADQHRNVHKLIKAKVAFYVNFHTLSVSNLKNGIKEVLNNPDYKKYSDQRSKAFRDQPEKPLDRAIWWCEFVIRNPNTTYLQPAEFKLGILGSHFWDIQVLIIIATIFIIWIMMKAWKKLFSKSTIVTKTKKQN